MNASGILNTKAAGYAAAAIVAAVALYLVGRKLAGVAGDALDEVKVTAQRIGTAVNPLSDQNLAYRGVNAAGAAVSGDKSFSLGSWLYDVFHKDYDPNAPIKHMPSSGEDERSWWQDNSKVIK